MGFGFENDGAAEAEGEADWANMDATFGKGQSFPLDFAKGPLTQVFAASQAGKQGKTGLQVRGHFFVENLSQLTLGLEITNTTGQSLGDFDIMFNKNPFAIYISGQAGKIALPAQGQSVYGSLPCTIDKKNLDGRSPPKYPFNIQVAMKTSLDVFYFSVPCQLHCLFNFKRQLTPDDYKNFWTKIAPSN